MIFHLPNQVFDPITHNQHPLFKYHHSLSNYCVNDYFAFNYLIGFVRQLFYPYNSPRPF